MVQLPTVFPGEHDFIKGVELRIACVLTAIPKTDKRGADGNEMVTIYLFPFPFYHFLVQLQLVKNGGKWINFEAEIEMSACGPVLSDGCK